MRVVSVASGNEVAGARILARDLAEHHPDWSFSVLVLPGVRPTLHPGEEPFELAALDEALPAGVPAALRAALARPLLVRHALDAGAQHVVLLPPDAELRGPLDALVGDHAALLVPRLLGGLPQDGERPDSRDLLDAGEIDDALVAVRADDQGRAFVEWWIERRREDAAAAGAGGDGSEPSSSAAAGDRTAPSPLAAALGSLDGVARLEDPAYDVSYWNLHERSLADARLVRFAGFRADRPWWLSEHASRTLVLDDPALAEACGRRAQALLDAGWVVEAEGGGGARELPGGLVWNDRLRRLHARALEAGEDFGDIYSPAGARAFARWLTTPGERGAAAGIGPYALDPYTERRDLRDAFGDLEGEQGERYVAWLWEHGRAELDLAGDLLPPPPAGATADELPPVLVTGYLGGNLGLGEAARGYTAALQAAGVPVATSTLVPEAPVERRGDGDAPAQRAFAEVTMPDGAEPAVNLLCVNAPQVPALARQMGEEALRSRYTIGQWAWETDAIPAWWDASFELVDEVWVYSRYVAENLARATDVDVPVVVMPLPVTKPDGHGVTVPFEVPDGFVFLFAFDFFSTLERKNPLGLVEAFKHAFEPGEGPTLLLKTINARFRPEARERLRHAIGDREDILLVDALLEPDQMAALFQRADSYVSLHRAEGYGLTLAESMVLGKPVVATGFSGNTDFMTPANSYLVDWTLTEVGPDAEHYPEDGTWAEPSLEHAAATLRAVVADPEAAAARGARAAADIAAWLTPEAVGQIARKRLARIGRRRRRAAAPAPVETGLPGGDFEHRLEFDLGGGDRGGPKGAARRALFRAMRPYTASERELDRSLAAAVRRLALELHRDRATHARERAQLQHRLDELGRVVAALTGHQEELRGRVDLQEANAGALAQRVDKAGQGVDELLGGARAEPYMAGEGLTFSEDERTGRVLGFSHEAADADAGDAYTRFEDVFRGSRERVAELVQPYVQLLAGQEPVLDVGCGRGELLEQLKLAGIEASGVDADAGMAERARAAGLDVAVGDGIAHLASLPPGSLGAITAIHVIEHLPADDLVRFFRLARERLRRGGLLVCETINPHAVHALKTFWVDPTHQHPVFPEVAVVLADVAGFRRGFMWFPRGSGDAEADRFREDAYAVVAEV